MRSLSPLQLAIFGSLMGSLIAVFVPEFLSNLHASRLAEPLEGLSHLASRATMHAAGNPSTLAYPGTAPRTPKVVPAGKSVTDTEGTWNHPTWRLLDFRRTEPHFFSFEFESEQGKDGAHFIARAFGDLDGDGELSRFEVFGESRIGQEPIVYPVQIFREVE